MPKEDQKERGIKLLQYANEARLAGNFNDVIIKAGNESFPANKLILSCFSNVLEKMFITEMKERYQDTVEINEFESKAVIRLLDYIYTGYIFIDNENVMNLLSVANFLHLQDVVHLCFDFLKDSISIENWSTIFSALQIYQNDSLLQHVYGFISKNLNEIFQEDEFKKLKVGDLILIVQNIDRKIDKEIFVYKAMMSWIKHDEKKRKPELYNLFQLVNLEKLPPEFLEDIVVCDLLIKANLDCLNTVTSFFAQRMKQMREGRSKLLCLGGFESDDSIDAFQVKELCNLFSKQYPALPYDIFQCCALKFKEFIYCIGGAKTIAVDETTDRVIRMNIKEQQLKWEDVASMTEKRGLMSALVFENCLVVAGGVGNQQAILASAEFFDPMSSIWQQISNLNQARCGHQLVVCDGCLYALGGCELKNEEKQCFASVEKLSSLNGEWQNAAPMNTPRTFFAAVNCNGSIFAIGGCHKDKGETMTLNSVEKFCPFDKTWTFVAAMKSKRDGHAACVLRGKIFVVGGVDEDEDAVLSIECYDPENDSWSNAEGTSNRFTCHSLIAL